jgi:hypothetical protein
MNFHSNPAMFKASGSVKIMRVRKRMAAKTVDRTFLQGQGVDLFCATIKSQATLDPHMKED